MLTEGMQDHGPLEDAYVVSEDRVSADWGEEVRVQHEGDISPRLVLERTGAIERCCSLIWEMS
jgi:hypothetical protein